MTEFHNPQYTPINSNSNVLPAAQLFFYDTGTSNLSTDIFSDSAETVALSNPVIADGAGMFVQIFTTPVHRVVLKTSVADGSVQIYDLDPVGVAAAASGIGLWDSGTTYNIPDVVFASNDKYYQSITDANLGNNPVSSPTQWSQKVWSNQWNTNEIYGLNDQVVKNGITYQSKTAANTGNDPEDQDRAKWLNLDVGSDFYIDSSATDAYILAPAGATVAPTAYVRGHRIVFFPLTSNTVAATVNVAGLGERSLKDPDGNVLFTGEIQAGQRIEAEFTGTEYRLVGYRDDSINFTKLDTITDFKQDMASLNTGGFRIGKVVINHGGADVPASSEVDLNLEIAYTSQHLLALANNGETAALVSATSIWGVRLSLTQIRLINNYTADRHGVFISIGTLA